jgi:DNA-directed RNA polymerase subunit F
MMGGEKGFEISRLLEEINKIDTNQFSNYTKEEALAFAKIFSGISKYDYQQWVEELKNGSYDQRE